MSERSTNSGPRVAILAASGPQVKIFALTPAERLRRLSIRLGLTRAEEAPQSGTVIMVRDDVVLDEAVLKWLGETPDTLLVSGGTERRACACHIDAARAEKARRWLLEERDAPDVPIAAPGDIGSVYRGNLRKRADPIALRVRPETAPAVERRLFDASYKGVTDLVTKYLWPRPALAVTRLCAKLGLTPNMVTTASAVLVGLALWLFWRGDFGWGLLAAWGMTFLDTVDGKLARTTLTSSPLGNVFDHGIDLVHPPFWYWAWAVGVEASEAYWQQWLLPALVIVVAGYVLGRLQEGYFIARYKTELHIWRPFDSFFRLIVARRNPNLLLLTGFWLAGRPDWGLIAVAVWTLAGLCVHSVQITQAEAARRRGEAIVSYLERGA